MNANSNKSWFGQLLGALGGTDPDVVEKNPQGYEMMSPEELERAYFAGDPVTRAAIKQLRDRQKSEMVQAQKMREMKMQGQPVEQPGVITGALRGRQDLLNALGGQPQR